MKRKLFEICKILEVIQIVDSIFLCKQGTEL